MELFLQILKLLLLVSGSCYILTILVFIFGWCRLKIVKPVSILNFSTKITILVPARNEEDCIIQCIQDIEQQNFPHQMVQLILINDHSTDSTLERIEEYISKRALQEKKIEIKVLNLIEEAAGQAYKKKAISLGITHATGTLIITTDADCRRGKDWLSALVGYYEQEHPKFISGPVSYFAEKNWFEKFQTLEFLGLIGIGAASISCDIPIMCNGANLAFSKAVFNEVNGYEGINSMASGDDVFLMLKIAQHHPKGIHFLKSREAIVYTSPKASLSEFLEQRKRWASKGAQYKNFSGLFTGICTYLFNLLLLTSAGISIFYNTFAFVFIAVLALKLFVEFLFLYAVTGFFRRRILLLYFLQEQMLYTPYIIWVGAIGTFKTYTWKGRQVK
jgi:cellulose synthase/poly-beta-1,6-N-acetylglucosamine synthase-like glycosyltransferase